MTRIMNKKIFKIFNPGKDFPAISLSSSKCELNCAHCGGKYLHQMLPVNSPAELWKVAQRLEATRAKGALVSGGCDSNGRVMLDEYLPAIKDIKAKTTLKLNIHTGILDGAQVKKLSETGADIASVDIVGDSDTIRNVYGLKHSPNQYKQLLQALSKSRIKNIVPHICIGLNYGRVVGEFQAIDLITDIEPTAIVFLILIPTKDSRMADCAPPKIDEAIEVINYARTKFSQTPIYLGCMRPRSNKFYAYRLELERRTIDAGINGIVLPAKATIEYLRKNNFQIKKYKNCCAVG